MIEEPWSGYVRSRQIHKIPVVDVLSIGHVGLECETFGLCVAAREVFHHEQEGEQADFVPRRFQEPHCDGNRGGTVFTDELPENRHADSEETVAFAVFSRSCLEEP